MKIIVQRVLSASVEIDGNIHKNIKNGLLALVGISNQDNEETLEWIANKLVNLRIFNDKDDRMNLSVKDINGEILIVPNFTIYGNTKKGFRPSFINSAKPDISKPIFTDLVNKLCSIYPNKVGSGVFGADMKVNLINDGPVTIVIEK
ncbi:MAG: D-aminoacyl-tRNA deacylase [Chlorobiota bacterium]